MFSEIRHVVERSSANLVKDAMGAAALMAMMLIALHLPSFF